MNAALKLVENDNEYLLRPKTIIGIAIIRIEKKDCRILIRYCL